MIKKAIADFSLCAPRDSRIKIVRPRPLPHISQRSFFFSRLFPARAILTAAALIWPAAPLSAQVQRGSSAHRATETITIRTTEGTALSFDLTPDGRNIIFDLLGQLWSLPVEGGEAVALTDAARDTADDADPAVSPDGEWIVFRSDRPQGRGLWLRSRIGGTLRKLTDSTYRHHERTAVSWAPDGRRIAYLAHWQLRVRNMETNEDSELHPPGLPRAFRNLMWSPDGKLILVTAGYCPGRTWAVDPAANTAVPLDSTTTDFQAPRYSPDGSRIAYFSDCDSTAVVKLHIWERGKIGESVIVQGRDLTRLRVRWSPDGRWLYYSADGKLWRVSSDGGTPAQILFMATLTFTRPRYERRAFRIPLPGETTKARGFAGLALAPDARRYAILALGKLWIAKVGGMPRAIRPVPGTAYGLSWSPDGRNVVWSAGRGGAENLFVTDTESGDTRQLTSLPGSESLASWSPDGRLIAFVHWAKPESSSPPWAPDTAGLRIRVIDANRSAPATLADTRDLGPFSAAWLGYQTFLLPTNNRLNWNATSTAVLTFTNQDWPVTSRDSAKAVWLGLDGSQQPLNGLPVQPSFLRVAHNGSLTYVQDGLLQRRSPSGRETQVLSRAAAMDPSVADDGTVLFASDDGLRVRRPDGAEEHLGWPIPLRVAAAPAPLLIRNARIFDGSGIAPNETSDILIEGGRIRRIAAAGAIRKRADVADLDAAGRTVIPGLIDAHVHLGDPATLRAALYFGVTTVRDMGSPITIAAARRDEVLAGEAQGPRVVLSGFMFYPSPHAGGQSSDMDWIPRDSATMERGLSLLRSFGGEHAKMLFPLTFSSGAMFVRIARANGFNVSGHCANPLPLVAAGISGQEHLDGQCDARSTAIGHDDRIQLYRAAGLYGGSTSYLNGAHARASRDTSMAHESEIAPFLTPRLRLRMLSDDPNGGSAFYRLRGGEIARVGALRFHQAGLTMALGSDDPGFPDGLHGELAEVVTAGLTPSEALVAATSAAARVLDIDGDVGTIAVGKLADLVLLDADPTIDIRNTRRIWRVIQGGRVVDRAALRAAAIQRN